MLSKITRHISNIPGWSSNRKILVIESDDWGSTRFKDRETRDIFLSKYPKLLNAPMNMYDGLESNTDLSDLYEVLSSFKDRNGRSAVITAFCNPANPDYQRIREKKYQEYYYEPFTATLQRYPSHDKVYSLYNQGIAKKLFIPQYHGREHLQINRWIKGIRQGIEALLEGFKYEYWSFGKHTAQGIDFDLRAAFDIDHIDDLSYQREVNHQGLTLFKEIFGYPARVMVPPNGPFNRVLEQGLSSTGLQFMGMSKIHKEPIGNQKFSNNYHYLGKKSRSGLVYITRNATFEPFKTHIDWVATCMAEISSAFLWRKPAVISTHRVNFIGLHDENNKKNGLKQLSILLNKICKTWPDVEFMASDELGDLILADWYANQN